jgi:tetratricopeptide (TPR) repeat protein
VSLDLQLLFRETADLSAEERARYFDDRGVPPDLRAEVESLLLYDAAHTESLADCVSAAAAGYLGAALREGSQVGPYRLVRLLGEGGMGAVFLAERTDGEVEQRVAIKFVGRSVRLPEVRDRFLRERRILASLHHPGIARLLDAGHTADGQPYFVMEYVEGAPIDVFAEHLALRDRLQLFLLVCDAVSYAHRNLVIHRDLKPSNILVQPDGQPKLLDFGIARMLDEAVDGALTRERILTPDYASPEQVCGSAHTTATDVYSLGAVLYRILAGRSPHAGASAPATPIETVICTEDAPPPGRWNPEVPRDLDCIAAKALRKRPEERYAGVDALAEDIRAFLDSRPVRARAGSAWYRARKFVRRRWLPVCAGTAAIAGLSVGLLVAERERATAQHRFQQLRQLATRLMRFDDEARKLPGSTRLREEMVSASMEYLEGLSREAGNEEDLNIDLATGYIGLAQAQGLPGYPSLGDMKSADASLCKADDFAQRVLKRHPGRTDALLLSAEARERRMIIADTERRRADAEEQAREAAARLEELLATGRASADNRQDAARTFLNIGQAFMNARRFADALRYARRAVDLGRSSGLPADTIAAGLSLIANTQRQSGDLEGALRSITEARSLIQVSPPPTQPTKVGILYAILWRQGLILGDETGISLGRPDDAIEPLQQAFDLVDRLASKDPDDFSSRDRVATAGRSLAGALLHRDPAAALQVYDRALERQREVTNNTTARREEALLLAHSSYALRMLHRDADAGRRIEDAIQLLRRIGEFPADQVSLGSEVDTVIRARGDHESATGHADGALRIYRDLLERVMAARPAPTEDLRQAYDLSSLYRALGALYRRTGDRIQADRLDTERLELWRSWDRKIPGNSFIRLQLSAP